MPSAYRGDFLGARPGQQTWHLENEKDSCVVLLCCMMQGPRMKTGALSYLSERTRDAEKGIIAGRRPHLPLSDDSFQNSGCFSGPLARRGRSLAEVGHPMCIRTGRGPLEARRLALGFVHSQTKRSNCRRHGSV